MGTFVFCPLETLLSHIDSPDDLKKLGLDELPRLAAELREFIIDIVATKEGHLGASLGVVELTLALHYVFDTPRDKLIWDVGHQAYGHKILTGRKEVFATNRQLGGISGFPKRGESPYDDFGTGHSSTAISAILGMAMASHLLGEDERQHIAVVGDASIASGMAFEGLNHLGVSGANVLVVLNDNAIGIDPSVGALKNYLTQVKAGKVGGENFFQCLNLDYSGPLDGHDIPALVAELSRLKKIKGPRLLHITTTKGKGLQKAEQQQVLYHAPGKFDKFTGERLPRPQGEYPPKYQDVFGHTLVELAKANPKIVGITPAMPTGSSMKFMMDLMPDRAFDVGIAEQHALTLAAGMATQGLIPFCNIYSTFLQRAYDQLIHDVALQGLPVILCLDRAGLVGQDGPTHHGTFDIAFLRCVPNMVLFAPMDEMELRNIMYTAQLGLEGPIAIRYPRGRGTNLAWRSGFQRLALGKGRCLSPGGKVAVLSLGPLGHVVQRAIAQLRDPAQVGHYDMRFAKPLDNSLLDVIFETYERIITVEDGCKIGGFGSAVVDYANAKGVCLPIEIMGIPDHFVEQGSPEQTHKLAGIDFDSLLSTLQSTLDACG